MLSCRTCKKEVACQIAYSSLAPTYCLNYEADNNSLINNKKEK